MRVKHKTIREIQGKKMEVKTIQLEPDETERLVYMSCFITAITDIQSEMKDSIFYSKRVETVLDEYQSTKLRKVFSGEHGGYMADRVMHAEQVFSAFCKGMVKLTEQPLEVQKRFNDAVLNAFVIAGVRVEDYEPIKVNL